MTDAQNSGIQTKTQLQQVCEFLLANLGSHIRANQLDAFQTDGKLVLDGSDLGNGGMRIGSWQHSAEIFIEKFPHRQVNPYNLLALIAVFFAENGWMDARDRLQLADPELDIDEDAADDVLISIKLELIDEVDLLPDAAGPIPFGGERYRVALVPVDIATDADVVDQSPSDGQS